MKKISYINIFLVMIVIIISNSLFIVNEREQAIVTQFGKPVGGSKLNSGFVDLDLTEPNRL